MIATDITDVFMKKGSVAEAVDLAYVFGFEEKLSPQTNLTSYLQKSENSWKKTLMIIIRSGNPFYWIFIIVFSIKKQKYS